MLDLFFALVLAAVTLRILEAVGTQIWRGYTAWSYRRELQVRYAGREGRTAGDLSWEQWRATFWSRLFRNIVLGLGGRE